MKTIAMDKNELGFSNENALQKLPLTFMLFAEYVDNYPILRKESFHQNSTLCF